MELKWLEDFVAVATAGSFSAAAHDRHVTQPALSRRIRALEQWVGAPLINRAVYPVQLTPYGQEFLPLARETIAELQAIRADLRHASGVDRQQVRVLTLHTLASRAVPELLAPLLQADPALRIEMVPSVQGIESHFDALDSGSVQLLIAYAQLKPVARLKDYDQRLVARDALVPVASRRFIDAGGTVDLQRGKNIPLLAFSPFTFSAALLEKTLQACKGRLRIRAESSLAESLKAMCLQDLGVAWLPRSLIGDELRVGALRIVAPESFHVPMEVRAWRRLDLTDRRAVRLFEQLPALDAANDEIAPRAAGAATRRRKSDHE